MSESNEPNPIVRIRHAASGQVLDLPTRGVAELIRSGKLGPLDQVMSSGGTFVPWWEIPQFAALRSEVRSSPGAAEAPFPHGSLRSTDPSARRVPAAASVPVAPSIPTPAQTSGARPTPAMAPTPVAPGIPSPSRSSGLIRTPAPAPTSGSGLIRLPTAAAEFPSTIGPRSPFAESRLDDGPEALRDLLLGCTFDDIFGLPDSAPQARIQAAYAERVALIEATWTPDDSNMRTPAARNARLDVLRILAAALRSLTVPDERKLYDKKAESLGRSPRFKDVVSFVPIAVPKSRDEERGISMSESDEAILRYVGFDTQKIREAHAPKKKTSTAKSEPRSEARPSRSEPFVEGLDEPRSRPASSNAAIPQQRQIGWAVIAIVAIILLIASWIPRCAGADDTSEGRMVTVEDPAAE